MLLLLLLRPSMRRKDVEEDYFDGHEKEAKIFSAYENPISNGGRVEPLRDLEPFPPPSDFLDSVFCLLLKKRNYCIGYFANME